MHIPSVKEREKGVCRNSRNDTLNDTRNRCMRTERTMPHLLCWETARLRHRSTKCSLTLWSTDRYGGCFQDWWWRIVLFNDIGLNRRLQRQDCSYLCQPLKYSPFAWSPQKRVKPWGSCTQEDLLCLMTVLHQCLSARVGKENLSPFQFYDTTHFVPTPASSPLYQISTP